MEYTLQVFTGSWHAAHEQPGKIIRRIEEIGRRIPVEKVIIGWNTDLAVYRELGTYLHDKGIQMLLGLPVLNETRKIADTEEALDISGQKIVPPSEQAETAFAFDCPTSRQNIRAAEGVYEKHFAGCGFDGVFLDRIRTQSFAAGASGVLSCGCERCRKAFREKGVDTEVVRQRYEQKKDSFFDIASWPADGRFALKDPLAQRFFDAKEEIIAETAGELCRYFKEKGLIVGLDLFAPLVSRLVGQNYSLITQYADFIKPMLYRRTDAPAGIGYEYDLFGRYAPGAEGRGRLTEGRELLDTQLEAVRLASCEVYPGIELNYHPELVRTDPDYIRESLAAVRERGFAGAVLSWNVMEVPDAHIEAAAALE